MYVDFLYGTLCSAAKTGLPWRLMPAVLRLSRVLLDTCVHMDFNASLRTFQRCYLALFGNERNIPEAILVKLTDVFYDSFFQHYNLFRYCFTQRREHSETSLSLDVHVSTVESGEKLSGAKEYHVWEYEERIRQIEERTKLHRNKNQDELAAQLVAIDNKCKDDIRQFGTNDADNDARAVVKKVARAQLDKSVATVKSAIDTSVDELVEMLDKTALPRPTQLGAPPRFKPKSAVAVTKPQRSDTAIKRDTK